MLQFNLFHPNLRSSIYPWDKTRKITKANRISNKSCEVMYNIYKDATLSEKSEFNEGVNVYVYFQPAYVHIFFLL